MALGTLFLWFVIMSVIALLGIILLFVLNSEHAVNVVMVLLTAFSLLIAYMSATAQPTNYTGARIIAWVIGLIALIGLVLKFTSQKALLLSKILVSASVIVGIIYLYFV